MGCVKQRLNQPTGMMMYLPFIPTSMVVCTGMQAKAVERRRRSATGERGGFTACMSACLSAVHIHDTLPIQPGYVHPPTRPPPAPPLDIVGHFIFPFLLHACMRNISCHVIFPFCIISFLFSFLVSFRLGKKKFIFGSILVLVLVFIPCPCLYLTVLTVCRNI